MCHFFCIFHTHLRTSKFAHPVQPIPLTVGDNSLIANAHLERSVLSLLENPVRAAVTCTNELINVRQSARISQCQAQAHIREMTCKNDAARRESARPEEATCEVINKAGSSEFN